MGVCEAPWYCLTIALTPLTGQISFQSRLLRQAQGPPRRVQVNLPCRRRQCLLPTDARDQNVSPRRRGGPDGKEYYGPTCHQGLHRRLPRI